NDNKASVNHILRQAYGRVREGSKGVLGMYGKDVEILGGIGMDEGNIGEMERGEGKRVRGRMGV
ncbi:hypothetical protein, partial [Staphylococcus epidermidis]|uniref:hypothetical protein n=1 Tax=Staphylococcus epidermidis TaxID=1282 RepID=UPI0016424010